MTPGYGHWPASRQAQRGVSILLWLVTLPFVLLFGAFAVDVNQVWTAQAELQAAADAGALRGANLLYIRNSTNPEQNGELNFCNGADSCYRRVGESDSEESVPAAQAGARAAALANLSRGQPVEIVAVELGHWKFTEDEDPQSGNGRGRFTAWNEVARLAKLVDEEGDFRAAGAVNEFDGSTGDGIDINAVRVRVARRATPVQSIFAHLLGRDHFELEASAVGYIGFAGGLGSPERGVAITPFAICRQALGTPRDGLYGCNRASFNPGNQNEMRWTDLDVNGSGAVSASQVRDLIEAMPQCGGNGALFDENDRIVVGASLNVQTGVLDSAFDDLFDCWKADRDAYDDRGPDSEGPNMPWPLTVTLIDCSQGTQNWKPIVGFLGVNVIWMVGNTPDHQMHTTVGSGPTIPAVPTQMQRDDEDGSFWQADEVSLSGCAGGDALCQARARWIDFTSGDEFNVNPSNSNGRGARSCSLTGAQCDTYNQKAIYLAPNCNEVTTSGLATGGTINAGLRATVPVLVQ